MVLFGYYTIVIPYDSHYQYTHLYHHIWLKNRIYVRRCGEMPFPPRELLYDAFNLSSSEGVKSGARAFLAKSVAEVEKNFSSPTATRSTSTSTTETKPRKSGGINDGHRLHNTVQLHSTSRPRNQTIYFKKTKQKNK